MREAESDAKHVHESVMVAEVCRALGDIREGLIVDGTVGLGGHAEALLKSTGPRVLLLAFDRDPQALEWATQRLMPFCERVKFFHRGYEELPEVLEGLGGLRADRILLDLGMSSQQLASGRGFSVRENGLLDMRYDPGSQDETAASLLKRIAEDKLGQAFAEIGQVPRPRRLAHTLKQEAAQGRVTTMEQFRQVCHKALGPRTRGMDSAILPAMVLRILVNRELERLSRFLQALPEVVAPGGKVAILSYHSGEDRLVKNAFRNLQGRGWSVLYKKGLTPSLEEVRRNPRARSARMRVVARSGDTE